MKTYCFIISLFFICLSCEKNHNKNIKKDNKVATIVENVTPKFGKNYFKFDEIIHYHIDFQDNEIEALNENYTKLTIGKIEYEIISGNKPENINDEKTVGFLDKIGFRKKIIEKSKFKEISKIFTDKTVRENYFTACEPIYRDILVFKNNKKNVGIAKICFDCSQKLIVGTNVNTDNFGQDGDYEKLERILKK